MGDKPPQRAFKSLIEPFYLGVVLIPLLLLLLAADTPASEVYKESMLGMPTLENSWRRQLATCLALTNLRGRASGYRVTDDQGLPISSRTPFKGPHYIHAYSVKLSPSYPPS